MNTTNEINAQAHQLNQEAWLERNLHCQEALRMAQQIQSMLEDSAAVDNLEMAACLRTQAYCQEQLGFYEEALPVAQKGMELAKQADDLSMIAMLDNVLGNIYWRLDDYASALNLYLHGLELVQKKPDPELEVYLVQGVGIIYYSMGVYEEALKYFKLSAEMAFPEEGIGRAIGLNNVACTLSDMKRGEEALPYALKAHQLFEQGSFSIANVLHTVGTVYLEIGDIEQAVHYLEAAVEAADQQKNRMLQVNALLGICGVHQVRGELELARQKLLRVLQIGKAMGSPATQMGSAHEMLAGIYKQMGDYQAALEHYETFHAIYIQRNNEEAYRRVHNAHVLREVETFRKQADLYRTLAAIDSLTGLLSRREFFELGEKAIREAQASQALLSLLMIDVDYFKQINDQYGHLVGDQALNLIAGRIKNALHQEDLAGRYGGDEFVILLPNTDARQCRKIAERCRRVVAENPIRVGALALPINISVGLAVLHPGSPLNLEAMIQQADQALLAAKKDGRNNVKHALSMPVFNSLD